MKYEIIKGSEKDFEGAPEWANMAVVFDGAGECGIDFSDGMSEGAKVFYSHQKKETEIVFPCNWVIIAERRPITEPVVNQQLTTEWGDDGLPPVGALCRYRAFSDTPWVECEVLGWHGDEVWLKRTDDGITFVMGNPELFPIRSPEDVARDEAKGIIAELCRSSASNGHSADLIYDAIAAGKIPGLTKTPTVSELMRVTENATREDCEAIVKMLGGVK